MLWEKKCLIWWKERQLTAQLLVALVSSRQASISEAKPMVLASGKMRMNDASTKILLTSKVVYPQYCLKKAKRKRERLMNKYLGKRRPQRPMVSRLKRKRRLFQQRLT